MIWFPLSCLAYIFGALLVSLVALLWWIWPLSMVRNPSSVPGLGPTSEDCSSVLSDKEKEGFDSNQATREDVINRYLRYADKEQVAPCTDEKPRDVCMQFLLAGKDSSAAASSWCLCESTRHPIWTLVLRESLDEICGRGPSEAMDAIQRMMLVHAVVKESLPLHSSTPDNYRSAVKDDIFLDGTPVPAGSLSSPSRLLTFGPGGRICPGRSLGLMEINMAPPLLQFHSTSAMQKTKKLRALSKIRPSVLKMALLFACLCLIAIPGACSKSPSFLPQQRRRQASLSVTKPNGRKIRTTSQALSSTPRSEAAWVSGVKNSMASALAAGCSKLILAPFDTIKTLQQHSRTTGAAPLTLVQAAQAIMKRPRGFLEFYAGAGVAVIGSMPSVGLYFGIYSFCKKTFQQCDPEHYEQRQTLYIALSAAIGNTIASASRVPYEVIKQKFQMNVYTSMGDAIRDLSLATLFPTGGIASQMLRDIPYAVVTLLTYEHLKTVWKPRAEKSFPDVPSRSWDMIVGGLAGGTGSFLTNPADVIKTRLQMDSAGGLYGGSILTCAEKTLQEGGPAAFMRGSVPRLLHKIPANSFFFLFYEFFRSILRVQDDANA